MSYSTSFFFFNVSGLGPSIIDVLTQERLMVCSSNYPGAGWYLRCCQHSLAKLLN